MIISRDEWLPMMMTMMTIDYFVRTAVEMEQDKTRNQYGRQRELRPSDQLQSIVGVAGGATKAAFTQHQARRDNMADVSAKDGSQVRLS